MQEVQELLTSDEAWGALYSYFRPYDLDRVLDCAPEDARCAITFLTQNDGETVYITDQPLTGEEALQVFKEMCPHYFDADDMNDEETYVEECSLLVTVFRFGGPSPYDVPGIIEENEEFVGPLLLRFD